MNFNIFTIRKCWSWLEYQQLCRYFSLLQNTVGSRMFTTPTDFFLQTVKWQTSQVAHWHCHYYRNTRLLWYWILSFCCTYQFTPNKEHCYTLGVFGWISYCIFSYKVMDIVGQRLMDQLVKTDLLERWSVMKQMEGFKWNFRSLLYGESRWSTCSWDVTGFVYGCLFVCDWHLQMVFASSEALMAIVHHSACVSDRGWARRTPTQVNDQSLQRKWGFMTFGNVSLSLK